MAKKPVKKDEEIVWEDPGPEPLEKTPLERKLLTLKERPGEWARVGEYDTARGAKMMATRLRKGNVKMASVDSDQWEFTARSINDSGAPDEDGSRGAIYSRYNNGKAQR